MLENAQAAHYHNIHEGYAVHYFDETSTEYRKRFIFAPILAALDLSGRRVADLACGSGGNSLILRDLYKDVALEGFDISEKACADYTASLGRPAHLVDLTRPIELPEPFDAAIIIGGLHHCVADLPVAIENLAKIVKPGGHVVLFEPNGRFMLQS